MSADERAFEQRQSQLTLQSCQVCSDCLGHESDTRLPSLAPSIHDVLVTAGRNVGGKHGY
jgi:hypothetical protein